MSEDFARAIAGCLAYGGGPPATEIEPLARRVLQAPDAREGAYLEDLQRDIAMALPGKRDQIALVYGGATKIKGYVFEAPKLPEIRGASALLDRINQKDLPKLWDNALGAELGAECIVYASGGNLLAFAPADFGQTLANQIEQTYTRETLTANSVAVATTCSLLEVRYGRLRHKPGSEELYWFEDFLSDWKEQSKRQVLEQYYYLPLEPLFTTLEAKLVLQRFFKRDPNDNAPLTKEDEDRLQIATRFFNRKTFGELVTVLATMANRRRESLGDDEGMRRDIPHYPLMPWDQKCASSDIRPAVVVARELPNRPALSEASARKAYVGRRMKRPTSDQSWFEQTFNWSAGDLKPWEKRFLPKDIPEDEPSQSHEVPASWSKRVRDTPYYQQYAELVAKKERVVSALDVGAISQASSPKGYIGLIYADGNNVGRRVARTPTPEGNRKLSRELDNASTNAVFSALARHLHPMFVRTDDREEQWLRTDDREKQWVHPFEIITIGGDDLLLIVPGSAALEIALTIGYEFEHEMRSLKPDQRRELHNRYQPQVSQGRYDFAGYTPDVGLSIGVVIAQENAPIFFLRDLVEELLKTAKKKAKAKENTDGGGAIDFMILKSITMVTDTISKFREQALGMGSESNLRLTGRPYSWPEFQGLLVTAQTLREVGFPRSQLYRLQQRLFDAASEGSIVPSIMEYLYTQTRGLKSQDRDTLRLAFDLSWHQHRAGDIAPWKYMPSKVRVDQPPDVSLQREARIELPGHGTIWPDLLEIYDFVARPGVDE